MTLDSAGRSIRTVVYVQLLDEGTDVWRPVPATDLGNGRYQLLATDDYDPKDETWEFPDASVVCEPRMLSGDVVLVATRLV